VDIPGVNCAATFEPDKGEYLRTALRNSRQM
jgi:hypothetical protein